MTDPTENSAIPSRSRPAHQPIWEQHNRSTIIFLTVCTKHRLKQLAAERFHGFLREAWTKADHWLVGRYVVMPDHLHLFCAPGTMPAASLSSWVRFWKTSVSKAAGAQEGSLWQSDYWDTQLRQQDSYAAKWEYVRNNPVRAPLALTPETWPYQGELNTLRWHD